MALTKERIGEKVTLTGKLSDVLFNDTNFMIVSIDATKEDDYKIEVMATETFWISEDVFMTQEELDKKYPERAATFRNAVDRLINS